VGELGGQMGKHIKTIDPAALHKLQSYPWPGNVRELRNVIERAMIISTGSTLKIELSDSVPNGTQQSLALNDVERIHIEQVLGQTGWRIRGKNGAAEILGLKPTTLEFRMAKLGVRRPGKEVEN